MKSGGNDFFSMVYDVTRQIPRGRVTSYGAIARYLGAARSARMVGWALNGCAGIRPAVPAHRVVNRNGLLSGKQHFGDAGRMARLLRQEGVTVKNDAVVDFQELFWDPEKELSL
jgi:methylated-DNA-protein-cysteine methyltransferase-like protein